MELPVLLIAIIGLALVFDYINGFHDAANSIATIVSTKVLTPFQAVLWAAFWNFAAFFIAAYITQSFWTFRGYCVEFTDLVAWYPILFVTHPYWWISWSSADACSSWKLYRI